MFILFPELRIYCRQHGIVLANILLPFVNRLEQMLPTPATAPVNPPLVNCVGQTFDIKWAVKMSGSFLVERLS